MRQIAKWRCKIVDLHPMDFDLNTQAFRIARDIAAKNAVVQNFANSMFRPMLCAPISNAVSRDQLAAACKPNREVDFFIET